MSAAVLRSGAEGKRGVEPEQKPPLSGRGEKGGWRWDRPGMAAIMRPGNGLGCHLMGWRKQVLPG